MDLFFYGTLCHEALLKRVLAGQSYHARPATLGDHAVYWVKDQPFPMIEPSPGGQAKGILVQGLSDQAVAQLNFYEGGFDYSLQDVQVTDAQGDSHAAQVYFPTAGVWTKGAAWNLADWADAHGEMTLEAAREVMSLMGKMSAEDVQDRFAQIRMRAACVVRARKQSRSADLRRSPVHGDVDVAAEYQPYTNYFAVREEDLRFRHFDGGFSPQVNRAAFVGGDAVIVLPYDPTRDRVLLVEQFRMGPHLRGDPLPWTLEPIAGRIDPGESPEQTARREAREEAGLALTTLEPLTPHYPSPGATTEYYYPFVATCELPDDIAGIGGLKTEAEDIKSHVLDYMRFMEFVQSGEVNCGPLILCAYWLALNRDRLRETS